LSRYVFYLLFALLLALSIGCASVGEKAKTTFSQEFSLRIGQSEQIGDAELEIKFEKVTRIAVVLKEQLVFGQAKSVVKC